MSNNYGDYVGFADATFTNSHLFKCDNDNSGCNFSTPNGVVGTSINQAGVNSLLLGVPGWSITNVTNAWTLTDTINSVGELSCGPGAVPASGYCYVPGTLFIGAGLESPATHQFLLPPTATVYKGDAAGGVVLTTGTPYTGSCAPTTTLTVVDGIITGCS
jgi:hypothetical protein